MECMAGKVAENRRFEAMGRVVDRLIDRDLTQYTHIYCVGLLVNSSSFVSWLLSSILQVTLTMVVHRQESDGCSCVDLTTPLGHETFRSLRTRLSEQLCVSILSKISLPFLSFLVFYAQL